MVCHQSRNVGSAEPAGGTVTMGGIRKRELTAKRVSAFSASNLVHVAKRVRRDYPTAEIVLSGDSDRWEGAHQRGSPFPRPRTTLRAQPPIPSRTGSRDGFTASGKGVTNPKRATPSSPTI